MRVNEQTYDIQNLNGTYALCYNNEAYDRLSLIGKSRCLPDTANPSYQWGFSTMLSGIFVFIHFGWCMSMYVVWLDAQSTSTLIREGYEMTPLRAAFAIAKAVKRKTGLEEKQLVRHDTKDLNKELYGVGKRKERRLITAYSWQTLRKMRRTTEDPEEKSLGLRRVAFLRAFQEHDEAPSEINLQLCLKFTSPLPKTPTGSSDDLNLWLSR